MTRSRSTNRNPRPAMPCVISTTVDEDTYKAIRGWADMNQISIAAYTRIVLRRHVREAQPHVI